MAEAPLVEYRTDPGRITALWRHSTFDTDPEIWLTFERFRAHHGQLQAEVTVESHLGLRAIRTVLTLQSESGRTELRRACEDLLPAGKGYWKVRVDASCWAVIDQLRRGSAPVELTGQPSEPRRWLVDQWIPWGVGTALYGDGDSGKSLLTLLLAVHALTGRPLGGDPNWRLTPLRGVLIADWEDRRDIWEERLGLICAGLEVPVPRGIIHQAMTGSLQDGAADLRSLLLQRGLDGLIIDSGSHAAGGELETSETAMAFANTVKTLPATTLITLHVAWHQTDTDGPRRPFGSIFFRDAFRSLVEVRRAPDPAAFQVTLRLEKANHARRPWPPPVGWEIRWAAGRITLAPATGEATLGPLRERLLGALARQPDQSWETLSETLPAPERSVRRELAALVNQDILAISQQGGGRGRPTLYRINGVNHLEPGHESWPNPAKPGQPAPDWTQSDLDA